MFDRTAIFQSAPRMPSRVNIEVNENRAPTPETAKLLKELEEQAEKNITARVAVENADIPCTIDVMYMQMEQKSRYLARLRVNGKDIRALYDADDHDLIAVHAGLVEAISKAIAEACVLVPLVSLANRGRFS
jgi:hypothetical protein